MPPAAPESGGRRPRRSCSSAVKISYTEAGSSEDDDSEDASGGSSSEDDSKGGGSRASAGRRSASDLEPEDDVLEDEPVAAVAAKSKSRGGKKDRDKWTKPAPPDRGSAGVDPEDLPVIRCPHDMFRDLMGRAPRVEGALAALARPLRVATMCSGTESPLLALSMICNAAKELYGAELQIEHVFSCEIEPFKQAYIERNFSPPILFRDIRELGGEKATTAYGSLVEVPGEVDLLVAGTSCVDYSNLNNEKKDLDAKGESGQTFRGMMQWVVKNRPPLVILENVCGAPWERVAERFEENGYNAGFMRVDTKLHYIPHTRTRGYLLATLDSDKTIPLQWQDLVRRLERPSSSTLEAFLLPNDDPRVHSARAALAGKQDTQKARPRTDWGRCETRHQRARLEEELGVKRPLTGWEDGGLCKLPDYAWTDWGRSQVDRVLDLMDINLLRLAKKGQDPMYKTLVWNLSQNVDRTTGSVRPGICPCLTPSMVPFVTNRGGPLVGLEALSLQGIPVDDLLLTRESEDNMADLAGNAMTTTVVGTAILAAILLTAEPGAPRTRRAGAGRFCAGAMCAHARARAEQLL
ncbi:S-adenosyl-L-methionine-dependent methyltransferase [Tribonema minus]|uniref:S-adenosyl-L-methionine-dependent methyltransferase n=1 Tax=Tribonema minus TaxID=303371 RepID=A0A836CNI4_9STRA|nr:S-adenosyl-L-methionine-dependent methyltransferase [Tribonema minus]